MCSLPASAIDLGDPDGFDLTWTPAAGSVSGYFVFASINGGPFRALAIAPTAQIRLQNVGLAFGDELVVKTQAFNANLDRGPFSPPSDLIRFIASPIWNPVQDQTLTEGNRVSVPLFAQIGTGASLKLSSPQLPSFARIDDFGNGSGRLLLEPQIGDAGLFEIRLNATDVGPPVLRTTETIYVRVSAFVAPPPIASPPLIVPIRDQSMRETQTVFIRASANTPAVFSGLNLPSFVAIGNAHGAQMRLAAATGHLGVGAGERVEQGRLSDPGISEQADLHGRLHAPEMPGRAEHRAPRDGRLWVGGGLSRRLS